MGRENARRARPSFRCHPFAYASASASPGSSAARRARARSRSRSVGADSIGHVRRASGRLVGVAAHVVGVEELAHRLPEGTWLPRRAIVRRSFTDEGEEPHGTRARGIEEIAVAARGIRPFEPCPASSIELSARLVVEERGGRSAPRERPLLETDHEDRLERSRSRPGEIENGDAAGRACSVAARRRPVEGRQDVVRRDRGAGLVDLSELSDRLPRSIGRAKVSPGGRRRGRRPEAVGIAQHRLHRDCRSLQWA